MFVVVVIGIVVTAFGAGAGVTEAVVGGGRPGWHLVWQDDFDGSQVSRSDWSVRNDTWAANEESIVTSRPTNVDVSDGSLSLTAQRERRTVDGTTRDYTSGYLDTIGRHSFTYGRFVIRARLPQSWGTWPAFWLRTDEGTGEIDVMEGVGGMGDSVVQTVHESTNGGRGKAGRVARLREGTTQGWHTYAVQVDQGRIRWSVDGRTSFTVTRRQAPWLSGAFDEPLNLRLNLQVGGSLPTYYRHPVSTASVFPASFDVDWVRVYQFGPNER